MLETPEETAALQALLDASHARATGHLRGIINDERTLTAEQLVALLTGMKVLSVATVTASGEPRISALDGHFLHGTWTFGTSGTSAKARHLARRPAVSVSMIAARWATDGPRPPLDVVGGHAGGDFVTVTVAPRCVAHFRVCDERIAEAWMTSDWRRWTTPLAEAQVT